MGEGSVSATPEGVRRLAVTKQHLAGTLPSRPTKEHILSVVRDLCYVQFDPIAVVAPSHVLCLRSRVGDFRMSDLDGLLWDEKKLFQHWPNVSAAFVLTEDYPLYYSMMKRYPDSLTRSWGSQRERAKKFLETHENLRKGILRQLKAGPLQLTQFEEYVKNGKSSDGWTAGSDVSRMMFHLEMRGEVMIVGHDGVKNVWGRPDGFLPGWVERKELPEEEFEKQVAQRAIRALGTASPREVLLYFPRGRYVDIAKTLKTLLEESLVRRVRVAEFGAKDERYVHRLDVGLLQSMDGSDWHPRVSLLPPFDNLLNGRGWLTRLFGFRYVHEMFFPEKKRKYGYYVMPILWGDRFIGRIDPRMDRKAKKLFVNGVYAEPGAPAGREVSSRIADSIESMAHFLGAKEVVYSARVPATWKSVLH